MTRQQRSLLANLDHLCTLWSTKKYVHICIASCWCQPGALRPAEQDKRLPHARDSSPLGLVARFTWGPPRIYYSLLFLTDHTPITSIANLETFQQRPYTYILSSRLQKYQFVTFGQLEEKKNVIKVLILDCSSFVTSKINLSFFFLFLSINLYFVIFWR